MKHPSDLALEQHLLDRGKHGDHVAGCARCQQRLATMEQEGQHFRQYVYPATLAGLTTAPRRRWTLFLAPLGVLAAAGLVLIARQPDSDYIGTKGAALKLTIYAADPAGTRAVADGAAVSPNASLRFKVHASAPCELSLFSVDESGSVSTVTQGARIAGEQELPGGAVLDGHTGRERFFAVCAPAKVAGLDEKVKSAGVGGGQLAGLPPGSTQATFLLDKRP